jgi:response regulator NasT
MREFLERLFVRLGHEVVVTANNGKELVCGCRAQNPDLVVTDVRMPELDGDQAVMELWKEKPVPVIVISAYAMPTQLQAASHHRMIKYLNKPVGRAELESAIQSVLTTSRFDHHD